MMLINQIKYCKDNNLPMFAPKDGRCFSCGKEINDTDKKHITGCPYCNYSFCE
jgi:hypothetical protein